MDSLDSPVTQELPELMLLTVLAHLVLLPWPAAKRWPNTKLSPFSL
ncbi:unnamed protein product [Strongylus vulgaris]|uniref:Uncharacterized protein n=1 Tax=Strongylus vulgaris TaxID=40348 RepID=A0A3P7ITK9_STRVU|nr:unnamed protein product [Strongylus vulgaris]